MKAAIEGGGGGGEETEIRQTEKASSYEFIIDNF